MEGGLLMQRQLGDLPQERALQRLSNRDVVAAGLPALPRRVTEERQVIRR